MDLREVDFINGHALLEGDTISFDHPVFLADALLAVFVVVDNIGDLRLFGVANLRDLTEAFELDLLKKYIFELFDADNRFYHVFLIREIGRAQPQDMFCAIFAIETPDDLDGVFEIYEAGADDIFDPGHAEFFAIQLIGVDLEPNHPRAEDLLVNFVLCCVIVEVKHILIYLDDGILRLWIVVDARIGDDLAEIRELDKVSNLVCVLDILAVLLFKLDGERWSLDSGRHIDDFLQPRHTLRHILGSDTSHMESIQCHLSGWLADGLGGN